MSKWTKKVELTEKVTHRIDVGCFRVTYHEGLYPSAYIWTNGSNSITNHDVNSFEEAVDWAQGRVSEMLVDLQGLSRALEGGSE